ncbi:hypothetical protein ACFSX9_16015 [Flavobacterium ardleyense]|uniref:DUF2971 domain-containing protein n=1 Tax=Flavobacterium ardleyense TaxID=2038737 RepID=A0ABW5ZBS5_9FLAO
MIPSHIYHYTSLETLFLILEFNTFRFNRLDRMNDPFDGFSQLYCNSRMNIFSSSWTSEKRDELPMWKIYSDLKGVRIRMPIDLFNFSDNLTVSKLNKGRNYLIKSVLNKPYLIERKELANLQKNDTEYQFLTKSVYGPTKVDYVAKKSDLSKGLVKLDKKNVGFPIYEINLNLIGQKKIDYWNFEKEYRYRIFYGDAIVIAGSSPVLEDFHDNSPIITNYIDIEFKPESLEKIEIILGPESNEDTKFRIEEILKNKNVKEFKILKSKIIIN